MTDFKITQYKFKPIDSNQLGSEILDQQFSKDKILSKIFDQNSNMFQKTSFLATDQNEEQPKKDDSDDASTIPEQNNTAADLYKLAEEEITKKLMEKYEAEQEALHQKFKAEYDSTIEIIKKSIDNLLATNEEIFLKYKKYFFDLTIAIAEKLALINVDLKYHESIRKLLNDILDQTKEMTSINLYIHPESLEKAHEIIEDINTSITINIKTDESIINKSDFKVEWNNGSIESFLCNRKNEIIKLMS